jgi:hypothetical protein
MLSINLKDAELEIQKFNNRTLANFLRQRKDNFDNPSELLSFAMQEASQRLEKELAMVWSNKKLKDESLDKILLEYKLIN